MQPDESWPKWLTPLGLVLRGPGLILDPNQRTASFCWTGGKGTCDSIGVTLDGKKVSLGGMGGVISDPSCPPVFP